MTTSSYTDYFRQLAVKHNQLQHNPDSETGDAPVGEKHFARFSTDEVITGLRTKLSFPALMIELYERNTQAQIPTIKTHYHGAFSIFCTARREDYQDIEAAYDTAEQILNDILAQVYQDHHGPAKDRCQSPFTFFDFNELQIMPAGPVFDHQFGWRCEFKFRVNDSSSFTTAPAEGVFSG